VILPLTNREFQAVVELPAERRIQTVGQRRHHRVGAGTHRGGGQAPASRSH
jgi:hypothetical protein